MFDECVCSNDDVVVKQCHVLRADFGLGWVFLAIDEERSVIGLQHVDDVGSVRDKYVGVAVRRDCCVVHLWWWQCGLGYKRFEYADRSFIFVDCMVDGSNCRDFGCLAIKVGCNCFQFWFYDAVCNDIGDDGDVAGWV